MKIIIMLLYFLFQSKLMKASSLWSLYSMLKSTLKINENIDISTYTKLLAFLKRQNENYLPKKSKVLSMENIKQFLNVAQNDNYYFVN